MILALILALFLIQPGLALAADFTATVDSNHEVASEGFSLQLTLSGTKAKSDPDTGSLQQQFTVVSKGRTSNTTIINGTVKSSVGWQLMLIPKKEGHVTIPAITIDTAAGTLSTQPIELEVDSAASRPSRANHNNISIVAQASPKTPFQDQPINYTVRVVVHANISDVSLTDIAIDHAIVEKQGKPEIYDRVENGLPTKVIEFHYIVTPLTAGKITIPPAMLQGNIKDEEKSRMMDPFDNGSMDLFRTFQDMKSFPGFGGYIPFRIASNTVELAVKPPAAVMDPWLPVRSLQIHETMDLSQQIKVGEPLTRKLVVLAEGAVGSQLPSLESQQNHEDFRVYGDKPATGENIDKKTGAISGWRRESYSLIPQKAGRLVLPEIKIPWWDISNNKIAYADVPERVVNVLPGAVAQNQPSGISGGAQILNTLSQQDPAQPLTQTALAHASSPALYAVLAALIFVLLFVVFWSFSLKRKMNRLDSVHIPESKHAAEEIVKPKPLDKADLNQLKTAQELNHFLRSYAHQHWGTGKNTSLESIFLPLQKSRSGLDVEEINALVNEITATLYAGKSADLESLKRSCSRVIASVEDGYADQKINAEMLQCLNPS